MLTYAYYFLKIIICSGILYSYYLLALKDKVFHKWNRFYLLGIIIISLAAPFIKINLSQPVTENITPVVQVLDIVGTNDEAFYNYSQAQENGHIDVSNILLYTYYIICSVFALFILQTLIKIRRLRNRYPHSEINGIDIINTDAKGTPFSFFNSIFWNEKIDLDSPTGQKILRHELAHITEKHSYDKLFINVVLVFSWINPFFWLIRKELNMIHEFIADKAAVEDGDTAEFAAMILQAAFPQQQLHLTNQFFYSPLKRRLTMLTKNKSPKINYASRLLVLPLAALVFLAFTIKMKTTGDGNHYSGKKLTVIIDAGHGGADNGASSGNINEKDLTLAIAQKIKELNTNENINIVLSRNGDNTINPKERVVFSNENNADLFVSIHLDATVKPSATSGLMIFVQKESNPYVQQSKMLASSMVQAFSGNYGLHVNNEFAQREKGIYILDATRYPAILIEAGTVTTQKDMEYILKPETRKLIAQNILKGIEKYAMALFASNNSNIYTDTVAKMRAERVLFLRGARVSFFDSKNGVYKYLTADSLIFVTDAAKRNAKADKGILIINDKKESNNILQSKTIVSKKLTIYSGDDKDMIEKYGEEAKNGVFVFEGAALTDPLPGSFDSSLKTYSGPDRNKVFTKMLVEPSFPGGSMAWSKFIKKHIEDNMTALTEANNSGTCRVRFIVETDGSVHNIEALTMKGTRLAEVVIKAIRMGPKWIPGKMQEDVNAYKEVPVTFTIEGGKGTN